MEAKTILVVDDDNVIRETAQRYLQKQGYNVKTLDNGYEVLVVCLYLKPDLIVTDIRMPKLDGLSLVKGLKNNSDTASIPVIFISALDDIEIMEKAKALGARHFLIKPFSLDELGNAINVVFNKPFIKPEPSSPLPARENPAIKKAKKNKPQPTPDDKPPNDWFNVKLPVKKGD